MMPGVFLISVMTIFSYVKVVIFGVIIFIMGGANSSHYILYFGGINVTNNNFCHMGN